jgi:formylglycine-generating enzyme required for sulfatase activity
MQVIEEIDDPRYQKWILPKLVSARNDAAAGSRAQLHIRVALIKLGAASDEDVAAVVEHMSEVYRDASRDQRDRDWATTILADYAADDPKTLANLLLDADESQFGVLFDKLERHKDATIPIFNKMVDRTPPADYEAKDRLAKQQANAAIALLRWDQGDAAWQMLPHTRDPSSRSYLIHRMGPMGVDVHEILGRLENESDVSAQRALILSLGEFPDDALSQDERQRWIATLLKWYREENDRGLHAAAEWLLRRWKQDAQIAKVVAEFAGGTQDDRVAKRQWYVNSQGQTMIVLSPAAPFLYGSPPGLEMGKWEAQVVREIRRVFAIGSKEVTVAQYLVFDPDHEEDYYKEYAAENSCPINAVTWFEAASYCNWLSLKEGLSEEELCFIIHEAERVELPNDYLQRRGYRLPTEAEFEYACRAGGHTVRYYGDSVDLLPRYEWYNGSHYEGEFPVSMAVGLLKPNDFGMFDMLGNVAEWCQERPEPNHPNKLLGKPLDVEDPGLVEHGNERAVRIGKFSDVPRYLRCAHRTTDYPARGFHNVGFRVVQTLKSQ